MSLTKARARRARQSHARNLRVLARLERNLQRPMRREIAGRANAVASAYASTGDGSGMVGVMQALNGHVEKVLEMIQRQYLAAAEIFGRTTLEALKGAGAWEAKDIQDDMFEQSIRDFLNAFGTSKIATDIATVTRTRIMDAIMQGQAEGLGLRNTAKLIRQKAGRHIARVRSHVIARTETHNAAGFSQNLAADVSGIPVLKRWLTAGDERVRDEPGNSHANMNSKTVEQGELFDFGGYSLAYPGDRNGPAEGVIMCRCFVNYEPKEV